MNKIDESSLTLDPESLPSILAGLKPPMFMSPRPVPLFSVLGTTSIAAACGKPIKNCFTGERWGRFENEFAAWLPANQPPADACVITTLRTERTVTLPEWSAAVIGGIKMSTDAVTVSSLLMSYAYDMTLEQVELMVEATERGVKTNMRTDSFGNFFFVQTGNKESPVQVGRAYRDSRDWGERLFKLDSSLRFRAGSILLVAHYNAPNL